MEGRAEVDARHVLEQVAEVARELARADGLDATLQLAADLAVEHLGPCDGAAIMLVQAGGRVATPATTSLEALRADQAQLATGEGPCLSAMRDRELVEVADLRDEDRWPRWREQVLELGWRSMLGVRLFIDEPTIGALNLYSREPGAFGERDRWLAPVFASHAAVALRAAIEISGLEAALASRDVIGQAKGLLMERERLTGQQAFDRLRELSSRRNVKLRELAEDIVATGEVPD